MYRRKGNFRWTGTFDDLKKLLTSFGSLNDKWSSSGGNRKMIEGDDVSLRWYVSSGTLMIKGEKAIEIGSQLRTLIDDQVEEAIEGNIDRLLEGDENSIAKSYIDDDNGHSNFEAEGSPNVLGHQSILDEFVHVLKSQVDSLTLKVSQCQSNS